ncbi:uncharacterized protein LOC116346229 [Contarinia nasturtii]|uniref:uncharacterized protein LOC116346229 n=1 Tax=Contarinia nasturtii TaxID=265458 RepID=UPI0012D43DBA|nr:uncharacterized protein LOC116346229 [Contarinia nasturtii]
MPFNQHDVKNTWGQFDGTITKWQGFHDRFVAAIHDNENVTEAYKFQYLKQSLVGQAKKDFGEWLVSDEGYKECWDRLKQMYDKKYLIRREYLRNFLRLPELHGAPSARELQHMANVTHETMRQLKAQGLPVEFWNFFIVHCLHERLDPETSRQWELQRETDDPGAMEMLMFIERQAAALPVEATGHRSRIDVSIGSGQDSRSVQTRKRESSTHRHQPKYDQKKSSGKPSHCKVPCDVCTDMHQIWECDQFLSLSFRGRRDFVDRRNICPNCLKKGHKEKDCFQRGCVRCPGAPKHNILLCPAKEVNKSAMNFRVQDDDEYSLTRKNKQKDEKKKKD